MEGGDEAGGVEAFAEFDAEVDVGVVEEEVADGGVLAFDASANFCAAEIGEVAGVAFIDKDRLVDGGSGEVEGVDLGGGAVEATVDAGADETGVFGDVRLGVEGDGSRDFDAVGGDGFEVASGEVELVANGGAVEGCFFLDDAAIAEGESVLDVGAVGSELGELASGEVEAGEGDAAEVCETLEGASEEVEGGFGLDVFEVEVAGDGGS